LPAPFRVVFSWTQHTFSAKKKLKKGWVKHTRRMNMDAKAVKCRVNATNLLQKKKKIIR
jgi:hypothetical protein